MFCGGTLVVDVRVICYSRVRERTSHSGPSYIAGRGEGVWEVAYVIETRRVVVKLFYWQGKVVN